MSSMLLVSEARRRGMHAKVLEPKLKLSLITYTDGAGQEQQVLIRNTRCELVSAIGALIADDKSATIALAKEHGLPVPDTIVYTTREAAHAFLAKQGRIVVKPSDAGHGDGVTTNLTTPEEVDAAVEFARKHTTGSGSGQVLLQTHCDGDDHRVLVVGGRMVAAAKRLPAFVIGDGVSTIDALIDIKNKDPRRGEGHDAPMSFIDKEEVAGYLAANAAADAEALTMQTIPSAGVRVNVLGVANVSRGGEAHDVTDIIHPELVEMCERYARVAGLGVCGADLVSALVPVCPCACAAKTFVRTGPGAGGRGGSELA